MTTLLLLQLATLALTKDEAINKYNLLEEENNELRKNSVELEQLRTDNEEKTKKIDSLMGVWSCNIYMVASNYYILGEINHLMKRAESQGKDLKKVLLDNGNAIAQFEKALIRKSGECDVR
jgi:DNA-binding ferritin-like protein (Dps family)